MATEKVESTSLPPEYMQPHVKQLLANVGGTYDAEGIHQGDGLIYQDQLPYVDQDGNPIPRVADFSQDQLGAHDLAREGIGAYQPYLDTANSATNAGLAGFTEEQLASMQRLNHQGLSGFTDDQNQSRQDLTNQGTQYNIGAEYLNPYQQEVTDRTMEEMRRQQNMDMNSVGDAAANAKSFGGSRLGVLESETTRGHDANRANILASMNANNFTQGQQAQELHRQRMLQGATNSANMAGMSADAFSRAAMNSGQLAGMNADARSRAAMNSGQLAGMNADAYSRAATNSAQIAGMGADANFQGAQIASGIGGLQQQYNTNDISTLGAVGDQQQRQSQLGLDTQYSQYLEDRDRPYQMAAFYNDMMSGVPSGQQDTRSSDSQRSGLAQGLGALGTLASAGNQFGWWDDTNPLGG